MDVVKPGQAPLVRAPEPRDLTVSGGAGEFQVSRAGTALQRNEESSQGTFSWELLLIFLIQTPACTVLTHPSPAAAISFYFTYLCT